MYFLRPAYRHTLADMCALLRHNFEKVEFLMFLMNVTNKSPNGGIELLMANSLTRWQRSTKALI